MSHAPTSSTHDVSGEWVKKLTSLGVGERWEKILVKSLGFLGLTNDLAYNRIRVLTSRISSFSSLGGVSLGLGGGGEDGDDGDEN